MVHRFGISPYLIHLMLLVGQKEVYAEGVKTFKELLQLSISSSQIQRLCNYFGMNDQIEEILQEPLPIKEEKSADSVLYSQVDGCYIPTDEEWKEVKLGRIFTSDDVKVKYSDFKGVAPRSTIESSDYLGYKGNNIEFTDRFDVLMEKRIKQGYKDVVFITDGEIWIDNWLQAKYKEHTCILDYYHATKRLADLAKSAFNSDKKRKAWLKEQKDLLLQSQSEKVLKNVDAIKRNSKTVREKKDKVQTYYQDNKYRMDYKYYLEQGWFIGSGAIESAHRNVVQHRMKLNGQRWGSKAQPILNLRAANKSNKWDKIVQLIDEKSFKRTA